MAVNKSESIKRAPRVPSALDGGHLCITCPITFPRIECGLVRYGSVRSGWRRQELRNSSVKRWGFLPQVVQESDLCEASPHRSTWMDIAIRSSNAMRGVRDRPHDD